MRPTSPLPLLVAVALAAAACQPLNPIQGVVRKSGPVSAVIVPPPAAGIIASEEGIASWYGPGFHGQRTASGEVYDMDGMTAAHRTLPLDTTVRVTSKVNGRQTTVRINDRGPFVGNRVIDLSRAAATEIDMIGPGTAPVTVDVLAIGGGKVGLALDTAFTVQVGAFLDPANAARLRERLGTAHPDTHVASWYNGRETFHRVRSGRGLTMAEAEARLAELKGDGMAGFVVREDHQ
jgi:rare lipoprotein A